MNKVPLVYIVEHFSICVHIVEHSDHFCTYWTFYLLSTHSSELCNLHTHSWAHYHMCMYSWTLNHTEQITTIIYTSMHTLPCVHIAELYAICACKAERCTICVHITEYSTNCAHTAEPIFICIHIPKLSTICVLITELYAVCACKAEHCTICVHIAEHSYHVRMHSWALYNLCTHSSS